MKNSHHITVEEARGELEAAEMRQILLKYLWDELHKNEKVPRPYPPMRDSQVKDFLKRILGF